MGGGGGSMTSCKGVSISSNNLFIPPTSDAAGCDVTRGRFGSVPVECRSCCSHSTTTIITIHQSAPPPFLSPTTGETQKAPNAMIRGHQGLAAVPITLGL